MFSYEEIFKDKKSVLIVTAHPDDSIVFFGGLMHQLRQDKKKVYVVVVTNGARGSRENVISEEELSRQRLQEETDALQVLGVSKDHLFCLEYKDGEVESNLTLIGEIAYYIRKCKPDIVCTHEPSLQYVATYDKKGFFVQHRDHRKIGEAVIDAVYPFSRDRSFFTDHYKDGLEPHSVYEIMLTDEKEANFHFDYTEDLEVKKKAFRAHKSQFDDAKIEEIVDSFKVEGKDIEAFNYVKLTW